MMASNILILPQLAATYACELPEQQFLLVAGGRPPATDWLQQAALHRLLWCIDHGADICRKANIVPQRLIGDGDSATPESWQWASSFSIPIDRYSPKKDLTDTQLALKKLAEEAPGAFVVLSGALGNRLDHTMSAVCSLAASPLNGCMADEQECVFFLHGSSTLSLSLSKHPKAISLLSISEECHGVSIEGVYWPLHGVILKHSFPYAISNELAQGEKNCRISLSEGDLAIYVYWE